MSILQRLKSLPWSKIVFYFFVAIGAVVIAIWAKKMFYPVRPIGTTPIVAPEAPQAAKVERIYIPGPTKIMIYDRQALLDEIPVPPTVSNNPHNQFTATAQVPASPHGGTAVAFINRSTGQSAISYQAKARPFFGWGGDGGVSVRGGVGAGNSKAGYVGGVQVRQKIIRVADIQVSGVGELNISTYQQPEAKAMVDMELFGWK